MSNVLRSHLNGNCDNLLLSIWSSCEYCLMTNNGETGCNKSIRETPLNVAYRWIQKNAYEENPDINQQKEVLNQFISFCKEACPYRPPQAS